jgi:CBS domain containing-hemolysin-like protein
VAAEFGTVSVRRTQVRQLAAAGNQQAARLLPIVEDGGRLDRYIAVCQIGITLSSLVLGAFGQAQLTARLTSGFAVLGWPAADGAASAAAVLVLVALTMFQVLLGELVPKSLALQLPLPTALLCLRPMLWSERIFAGFNAILNGSGTALLRLMGIRHGSHRHVHSPDEIDVLVVESADGGLLEPDERLRLQRALRLSTLTAEQVMVPRTRIVGLEVDTPWPEVVEQAIRCPYTRLIVYRGTLDHPVGYIHTKDVALHLRPVGASASLTALLRPLLFVPELMPVDRLIETLRRSRSQLALVADEYGGVSGLVAFGDLMAELLGEPADEMRPQGRQAEVLADGRIRLPGDMRLDAAERLIGPLPPSGATTIGGHVVHTLGRFPEAGSRLIVDGLLVDVEATDNHAIVTLIVTPPSQATHG